MMRIHIGTNAKLLLLQVLNDFITMAGYPAWPLRFSEFYAVGPLGSITAARLETAWQQYHKTSQRFGT